MNNLASRWLAAVWLLATGCASAAMAAPRRPPEGPVDLLVDLSQVSRKLFQATMTLPAKPGPLTLVYPEWIPGEHGPTGPIADLAGLVIHAGDKVIPWKRDDIDLYQLHIDVPAGVSELSISYEYLGSPVQNGFSTGASATARLAV